jgi:hypothetical protein
MDAGGEIGGRFGFGAIAPPERRTRPGNAPYNPLGTKILALRALSRHGFSAVRRTELPICLKTTQRFASPCRIDA